MFNLTGFSDDNAFEGILDGWKEKLIRDGNYRTKINLFGKTIREKGSDTDVLRGFVFV